MLEKDEDDGFLIDFDLAIEIDREEASGAPSKTGTKVFMAVGALYGEHHNFMHDLESFFWVLFWLCVHWNGPDQNRSRTEYESWNYKDTKELAEIKKGKVDKQDKFDKEVDENFTEDCRQFIPCVQALREETKLVPGIIMIDGSVCFEMPDDRSGGRLVHAATLCTQYSHR
jgi:hypothetical protein